MKSRTLYAIAASRTLLHTSLMILLLSLAILFGRAIAVAQSITDASTPAGLAPGAPAGSYALSGLENVNLFSGNLNFTIPLYKVGGRGEAQHSIVLPIESHWKNLYFFKHPAGWYYNPIPMYNLDLVTGLRPGYGPGVLVLRGTKMDTGPCIGGTGASTQTRLTFITPEGTELELRDTVTDGAPLHHGCLLPPPPSRGTVFVTNDGSGTTFISDTPIGEQFASSRELYGYLMMRDGTRSRIDNGLVSWTRDRNGNQITYNYTNDRVTLIKDSLNREVTIEYQQNDVAPYGLCDRIRYKGSGGVERIIRVSYSPLSSSFASGFAPLSKNQMFPPAIPDWVNDTPGMTAPFETNVISSIWLPDNRRYRLFYNSQAELARAELPTGGAFEYVWEDTPGMGYEDPYPQEILRRVKERRVFNGVATEQKTTYTYSLPGTRTGNTIVTVDNFDNNQNALSQEKHSFFGTPIPLSFTYMTFLFTDSPWTNGREFQTDTLTANGTSLLRRKTQTWRQRAPVTWCNGNPCTQDTAPAKDPRIVETITTFADANLVSKTTSIDPADQTGQTVGFDQFNNKTDIWEYDFGVGQPGAFVRRTHTDYVTASNYINASADPSVGAHLRSLKSQTWISSDTAGSNKKALTVYEYDTYTTDTRHKPLVPRPSITSHGASYTGTFTVRGNVTGTTSYINAASQTGPVTTSVQYDIAGNMVASVDGVGNVGTVTFSDSFCNGSTCGGTSTANTYAFVTGTTSPIPDTTGVQGSSTALSVSKVYDFFTGNPTSTTDTNGQTTSYEYDDLLDRLTAVVRPTGGGRTDYEYGDDIGNLFLRTLNDLDAGRRIDSRQFFDGLGRSIETRTYENSTDYISVKQVPFIMQQDPDTSVWLSASQTSKPFRPTLSEQPVWTTKFVDALGRTVKVRTPDNSIIRTSYSGNAATVSDQTNKQQKTVSDSLGRIKQVYEDPTGLNYLTSYQYDVLDNVTSVTQQDPVSLITQTRTLAYDSLKRLTSTNNPENGTVSYQYDQNGSVIVQTDARNVSTHYKYDALNRLTRRWYNLSSDPASTTHNSPALPANVGATDEAKLYYDLVTLPNGTPAFERGQAVGRLVAELYGTTLAGNYFGYDAVGRANLKVQFLGGIEYRITRSFNASDAVTAQNYPSQRAVSYNYDNAGRTADKDASNLAFTGNLGDSAQRTYARGITYDPVGLKQEQFGTNAAVYNKRVYNSRQQLAEILVSTTANDDTWDRGKIINDYSGQCSGATCNGTDNNGNLVKQQISIPGSPTQRQQQYTYDTLNRLKWVLETNGGVDQWRQWFKYDRWSNRTIDTTLEGSQTRTYGTGINNRGFEVEQSTNRLLAPGDSPLAPDNRQMRYDGAGNLVNDSWTSFGSSTPGEFTRKYDGDNRMVSAKDDTGGTSIYTYDASGARVRRKKGTVETWQVYGFDGELLAEYAANDFANSPQREYGYRNGQLLVTTESAPLGAAPPAGLTATAPSSGSNITLSWSQASGATNYRVERKPKNGSYTLAGTTSALTFIDSGTSSGNAYLYRVCAANGSGQCTSGFSNIALGSAITFATDPTIVSIVDDPTGLSVTPVRAAHINELRTAVTAVRQLAGLPDPTWTYQTVASGGFIHVEDVRDLRTQLDQALTALTIPPSAYADANLKGFVEDPLNATLIRAVHIRELRDRVRSGIGGSGGGSGSSFKIYWVVTDHLSTPRMLVDQTGTLANMKRHDYLPFGEELFQGTGGRSDTQGYGCAPGPGCVTDNVRQQFTQKERDNETGLDYFGARYYASIQGRFTGVDLVWKDSQVSDPQSWNKYAYARNNPLKYIDPTGEQATVEIDTDDKFKTGKIKVTATIALWTNKETGITQAQMEQAAKEYKANIEQAWSGTYEQNGIKFEVTTTVDIKVYKSEAEASASGAQNVLRVTTPAGSGHSGIDPRPVLRSQDKGEIQLDAGTRNSEAAHEFTHMLGVDDRYAGKVLSHTKQAERAMSATAYDYGWAFGGEINAHMKSSQSMRMTGMLLPGNPSGTWVTTQERFHKTTRTLGAPLSTGTAMFDRWR